MKKRIKSISIGLGLTFLLCAPSFASMSMMLTAHETDSARIAQLERNLPFLEAKVASTLRDGASKPISFDGIMQVRSQFHDFSGLADSSWLQLSSQGIAINGDQPFLRLGMVVSPGRNTVLWSTIGLNATFTGYNSYTFLQPAGRPGITSGLDGNWHFDYSHRAGGSSGRGVIGYEDLNAGIAVRSRPASFMLKMGSMNWTEASPLSIWTGSKRAFAWEYLAYEMEGPVSQYFNYKIASLEQVGRGVWNKQPFQGIDFSIIDLPWGLRGFFLYGIGQPFDKNQRYHIDMAVDLGYAGDKGSHVESGIGDSYRKFIFYRLSKRLENNDITFSVNNGFTRSSQDAVFAGYNYGAVFNQKFDIGRYGSEWTNGKDTVQLLHQDSLNKVLSWGNNAKSVSLGEGFFVEPNILSVDIKGSAGKNFRFSFDVAGSWVDTHFVRISPDSYDKWGNYYTNRKNNPSYDIFNDADALNSAGTGIGTNYTNGTKYHTAHILNKRTEISSPDFAVYGSGTYDFRAIQTSLELFFAEKDFYSPHSTVSNSDAFWAMGSNMVGTQTFLNSGGAEFAKNMRAFRLTLTPKTPSWHGYVKFGAGLNSQNEKSRDIIALPYRLNGATIHQSLNQWYAKWGLGTVTETYDFTHYQSGDDGVYGEIGTISKHTQNRFGDQSLISAAAPHLGGLRSDFDGASEIFVPFESPDQVIFNYFSGSTVVGTKRDIRSVWRAGTGNYSHLVNGEKAFSQSGEFVNMLAHINTLNGGEGVRVTDNSGERYLKFNEVKGDSADVIVNGVSTGKRVALVSESGFLPVNVKKSFDFNIDWALNVAKYIGYKNDLFLSLYYQTNGITKKVATNFFNTDNSDVLLVSHYWRSEPTIGLSKKFYITTLIGVEKWLSGKTWTGEYEYIGRTHDGKPNNGGLIVTNTGVGADYAGSSGADFYTLTGIKQVDLETTDLALGIGFSWDVIKRMSLHTRYKWLKHSDKNMPFNDYIGNVVSLELKAFF